MLPYITVSIDPPVHHGTGLVGTLKMATHVDGKRVSAAHLREQIAKYCTLEFGMGRLVGDMATGSMIWRLDPLI